MARIVEGGCMNTGGPAFPHSYEGMPDRELHTYFGMTLRDYFAAKAMQGLAREIDDEARAARWCYEMADAMLSQREKS
jgi:hypothetical protein